MGSYPLAGLEINSVHGSQHFKKREKRVEKNTTYPHEKKHRQMKHLFQVGTESKHAYLSVALTFKPYIKTCFNRIDLTVDAH